MAERTPTTQLTSVYETLTESGPGCSKAVNVNPELNVNWGRIIFSCLKMYFTSNVWCGLKLLQIKIEGQTILTDYFTKKLQNWNQNSR